MTPPYDSTAASGGDADHPRSEGHHFPGPGTLDRALTLVRFLRANCEWDAEQTAESLVPHLLEETHEVVDAIHDGDDHELTGELGDLLLNLAFQIVVAEERGALDADSVYGRLEAKMIRRHPHLFGGGERADWEALKARERQAGEGVLDGLSRGLDPLTHAYRIQERVAAVGFDWEDYRGALEKVREELEEVVEVVAGGPVQDESSGDAAAEPRREPVTGRDSSDEAAPVDDAVTEELGDLIFAVVNLCRLTGRHPTTALARANRKFRHRFEQLEALATERGIVLEEAGLEALDQLWEEIKEGR
jgi:uncharacterized protein YabN with tetrapyrrole methylase and pyrophosphatase domain